MRRRLATAVLVMLSVADAPAADRDAAETVRFVVAEGVVKARPETPAGGGWDFTLSMDTDPGIAVDYISGPSGVEQRITMASMPAGGAFGVTFAVDGDLTPRREAYFVELLTRRGHAVLRYGGVTASDANGVVLPVTLEVLPGTDGARPKIRIVADVALPAFPIVVRATLSSFERESPPLPTPKGEIRGTPVALQRGIVESVEKIMAREKAAPPLVVVRPRETHREPEGEEELEVTEDPGAPPPASHWPPIPDAPSSKASAPLPPQLPQTVGVSFKSVGVIESGYIPPDSMGAVGPTQVLVHLNGRIKSFTKAGALDGALNATDAAFWASVAPGGISDPQVRFDRLSGRWFLLAITIAEATNNKIVLAVSSGPTIANGASFTFYSFAIGTASISDASSFCDYPGFGIDAHAVYTGCNMFSSLGSFRWTSAFVIQKASVLSGGPIVVTGFTAIGTTTSAGPYAPRGVDNDDPSWAEGYIIGTDPGFGGRINIRRVSDPGGTPTLGPNVILSVANTNMSNQPASGSTTAVNVSDRRIFAATISKNKLTGVTSLWTAQSVETDAACVPSASGTTRRIGAKWYEIGNLTSFPSITRFGTLCTTGVGGAVTNSERGFLYPTVTQTGQGHMALGASFASSTEFVGVAAAGRLRTDPAAGTRAPETIVLAGSAAYTINDAGGRNRWGDYSATVVDPNDDQTIWTFQEYADAPANRWAVRVVQLKAPPPPVLATATPVCAGLPSAVTTVTGIDDCAAPSCANGLCTGGGACPEFFDPGSDTGGPGYANHIVATVSGGVTVNPYPATNIVIPASPTTSRVLQATLSLDTTATAPGMKSITISNPDGQSTTSATAILSVNPVPDPPTASNDGPVCAGGVLNLSASNVPDGVYAWTGPDGFTSNVQNPMVPGAGAAASGTYSVTVTVGGCASSAATTFVTVLAEGTSCDDADLCTFDDACAAGACTGTAVSCTDDSCGTRVCNGSSSCTVTPEPDGTPCDDGDGCTTFDACLAGACEPGPVVNCSDNNPCTDESCDPAMGCVSTFNTGTCDDANACTAGDTCNNGSCEPGAPVPPPGDVVDVHMDAVKTLVWPFVAGASRFDVVSATVDDLRLSGSAAASCLADDVPTTSYFDVRPDPPAGGAYFYLVRAQGACGSGGYGSDSASAPRVPTIDCP